MDTNDGTDPIRRPRVHEAGLESAKQAEVLRAVSIDIRHVADWCDAHTGVNDLPDGIREKRPATPTRKTPAVGIPAGQYSVRPSTRRDEDR